MTALSTLLANAKTLGRNVDYWVEQADRAGHKINRATVYKYLDGDHAKNPSERTLQALAFVFDLDVRDLRAAVDKPRGELGAWTPVSEAGRLSQEQRDALDELIKTIVATAATSTEAGAEHVDSAATNTVGVGGQEPHPGAEFASEEDVEKARRGTGKRRSETSQTRKSVDRRKKA